jgi:TPR repeat protein
MEKAVHYYQKSAQTGNSPAMNNLANCYEIGDGIKKDLNKAVSLHFNWV